MGSEAPLIHPRYGDTPFAAQYLCLSERYLEDLRRKGGGPAFIRHGKAVRYAIDDLDEWALGRRRLSTSEAA